MSENSKQYDVAFLPINNRLISLSERLAKPLERIGLTTCVLKTALQGEEVSGWKDADKVEIPIITVDPLWYDEKSSFIKNTYRVIKSTNELKASWSPPFKLLVVFMDTYADGEVLTNVCRYKGVPTIFFQEGFHSRGQKYSYNLYGLVSFFRAKLLSKYFTDVNDGMYADYVAVWSEYGSKRQLEDMARKSNTIYVVGCPLPNVTKASLLPVLDFQPVVLVIHQPLSPRYCSEKWEKSLYVNTVSGLVDLGYKVIFKPHPRVISNEMLDSLKELISTSLKNHSMVEFIGRNSISENLLDQCDALISFNSVTSYTSLRMGIPTVFIKTPLLANKLLNRMSQLNEICYATDAKSVVMLIDQILKNEDLRNYWFNQGPLSANKLSGSSEGFDNKWSSCINELVP